MTIQLELPYPPSVNHYWGQRGNHRFIGKKGKIFREEVVKAAEEIGITALEGRLAIHIILYPPDRRKRDIDNVLKGLLDACEHAGCFTEGDNQIDELHIVRKEIIPGGGCSVIILPI